MNSKKSSRFSEIMGDFGERLVCKWLSQSGWEVVHADHTGIDLIAYDSKTKKRIGISVKSRLRTGGTEAVSVDVFRKAKHDRNKVMKACDDFNCEAWIAIYVEASNSADLFLTSVRHYDAEYRGKAGKAVDGWKMTKECQQKYADDPEVKHIGLKFDTKRWKW